MATEFQIDVCCVQNDYDEIFFSEIRRLRN